MSLILFYDTSTAGKPINWKLPHTDTFNWPRLIQLSWLLMDDEKKIIENGNFVVKPSGFVIDDESAKKYQLSQEEAAENGIPLKEVLDAFSSSAEKAEMVFCHNQQFNENVLAAEYLRMGLENPLAFADTYCLMRESTYFCRLPGKGGGFKWPSLQELYNTLFGKRFMYANNSFIDVKVVAACYFALKEKGALDDLFD